MKNKKCVSNTANHNLDVLDNNKHYFHATMHVDKRMKAIQQTQ